LLGGNNRVLGVGVLEHPDLASAMREIEELRNSIAEATFIVDHAETGQWWWRLGGPRGTVARSAQGFARRVDAELSANRFRDKAATAPTDEALVVFDAGRRGRVVAEREHRSSVRPSAAKSDVWPQRPVG